MNINSNKRHQHPIYFDKISVQYIATTPGGSIKQPSIQWRLIIF